MGHVTIDLVCGGDETFASAFGHTSVRLIFLLVQKDAGVLHQPERLINS